MKISFITTIVLLSVSFCFAEGREGKRKPPPHIIEKFDTDGDGKLNETERQSAREQMKAKMEERREFRRSFDLDGDGELNESERQAFEDAREQKILEHFDQDGDGYLNVEEQSKADKAKEHMKKRMKKCKEGRNGGEKGKGGPFRGLRGGF